MTISIGLIRYGDSSDTPIAYAAKSREDHERMADRTMALQLRQAALTWHVAGDDVVILDLEGSVYLKLNGSARVLWELLASSATEAELASALVDRFGIDDDRAAADVTAFLADLRQRNLLALR